jgi:hypothetical protein
MTKDLDVFIESSPQNAVATYRALAEFGAPLAGFTLADFSDGRTVSRFGNPPICFEVIQRIDGIDFAKAYANSQIVMTDGDLPVRYISPDDLIATKLAAGRDQDLADVTAIRNAQRVKREKGQGNS